MDESRAQAWCLAEMAKYQACNGWSFRFSKGYKNLGQTEWATHTIAISRPFVRFNGYSLIIECIQHEIAHVLAGLDGAREKSPIEGVEPGHGPLWAAKCAITGADATRPTCSAQMGPRWAGRCQCTTWPNVALVRYRTVPPPSMSYCRRCGTDINWQNIST